MRMVVVLPAPLGPMNPYTSPFSSFSVSRLRAYRSPYIFVRSRVSIMGVSSRSRARLDSRLILGLHRQNNADIGLLAHCTLKVGPIGLAVGQRSQPERRRRRRFAVQFLGPALLDLELTDKNREVARRLFPHQPGQVVVP